MRQSSSLPPRLQHAAHNLRFRNARKVLITVISNAGSFILESASWGKMCLCEGSNQRFRDFLDTAIRKYLLKKAAK